MNSDLLHPGQVFSVSEVNERIKSLFDIDPQLLNIAVVGELSNYKIYPSGHHYFTLKDSESSLKCVMFKTSAMRLRFRPENGLKVIVTGRISVYPRDGAYQLYANAILPDGQGDLQLRFEQLKASLSREGLFDASRKKPLPEMPKKIAVITSPAGAAVRDIIRVLRTRWPIADVVVVPVRVQGTEAPAEIADAIDFCNAAGFADVIITGRGGGSLEDLWAFNEEIVARAIDRSEIPVISAVGHEPDVTISDYVADRRASTPSNAAEIAVPDRADFTASLREKQKQLDHALLYGIRQHRIVLSRAEQKVLALRPDNLINEKRMLLDSSLEQMDAAMQRKLRDSKTKLQYLTNHLEALSPDLVLKRGYSITMDAQGGIVRSASELHEGDRITVRFADGTVSAECR